MEARTLLVCGVGSGMDGSLQVLRTAGYDLVVLNQTVRPTMEEVARLVIRCDPEVLPDQAILKRIGREGIAGVLALGADTVRALTTAQGHLARLSIFPTEQVKPLVGDVCDPFHVRQALDGADAVIHCAFGSRGSIEERWRTTVDGTRNVIRAATEQGVRRLVHISTAEVYSPHIEGVFDEKAPRIHEDPTDREYEQQKAVAERMVVSNFEDYVVLQPGIVYGPFGKQWTVAQLERLNRGVRGLPAGNDGGWCNAIYVDDVVDAALAAVGIGPAYGSTLLLNGPEVVCWGQFFDGLRTASAALPEHNDHDRVTCDDIAVPEWESALYQRQAIADSSLARATLGWSPQFDLRVGMELTRRWAEWMHRPLTDA